MLDPIHPQTHENLLLGEGVLLRGVDLDAAMSADRPAAVLAQAMEDSACLIGATKAGCSFRCQPTMLDATHGRRTPAAGELLSGRWQVTLSGTLLEATPANAAMLLNLSGWTESNGHTLLAPAPAPAPSAQASICWVGMCGSGLLAIELQCPVSTGGLTLHTIRNGVGELPFTLSACKPDPADSSLPCRLLWLKGGAA